jgi:hypothetical protein
MRVRFSTTAGSGRPAEPCRPRTATIGRQLLNISGCIAHSTPAG